MSIPSDIPLPTTPSNTPINVGFDGVPKESDALSTPSPMKSGANKTNVLQKNFIKSNPSFSGSSVSIGTGISKGEWRSYNSKHNKIKTFVMKQRPCGQSGIGKDTQIKRNISSLNEVFASQLFRLIAGKNSAPKTYLYEKDGEYYVLSRKIGDQTGDIVKNIEEVDLDQIPKENSENIARSAIRALLVSHILGDGDIKPANMMTDFRSFYRIDFSEAFEVKEDLINLLIENNELSPVKLIKNSFNFEGVLPFVEANLDVCKQEIIEVLRIFSNLPPEQLKELLVQFKPIARQVMQHEVDIELDDESEIKNQQQKENEGSSSEDYDIYGEQVGELHEEHVSESYVEDGSNIEEDYAVPPDKYDNQEESEFGIKDQNEDDSSLEEDANIIDDFIINNPYFKQRLLERMREEIYEEPEITNEELPKTTNQQVPKFSNQSAFINKWDKEGVNWIQTWVRNRQEEVRQLLEKLDRSA